MDEQTKQKFQERLESEKKKLEYDLSRIATKDPEIKNDYDAKFEQFGDDEDENAQEVADVDVKVSEEHILELKLLEVKKALERIKDDTFGQCHKCGEGIGVERLDAMPETNICIKCSSKS